EKNVALDGLSSGAFSKNSSLHEDMHSAMKMIAILYNFMILFLKRDIQSKCEGFSNRVSTHIPIRPFWIPTLRHILFRQQDIARCINPDLRKRCSGDQLLRKCITQLQVFQADIGSIVNPVTRSFKIVMRPFSNQPRISS